jgi:hypothetical protein
MSETDKSGSLQAIEAARQRSAMWQLCGYTRTGRKLVLRSFGPGPRRSFWRREPDAFLVLHSTRYVRLEGVVSGLELATGAAVNEVMQYPPPASTLTENSNGVEHRPGKFRRVLCCLRGHPIPDGPP